MQEPQPRPRLHRVVVVVEAVVVVVVVVVATDILYLVLQFMRLFCPVQFTDQL